MSRLYLLRHGQASFLAEDYDQLSELGEQQATQLGTYYRNQQIHFDAWYTGPRKRQIDTAHLVRDALISSADQPVAPVRVLPEFDEHHVDQLVTQHAEQLAAEDATLRGLFNQFRNAANTLERSKQFQQLFAAVASRWVAGEPFGIDAQTVESWVDFRARVNRGLDTVMTTTEPGQNIAVFTSVGPIGVALQRAMSCSDKMTLTTSWQIRNASISQFLFSGDRFTLDSFNGLPHLATPDWTYR